MPHELYPKEKELNEYLHGALMYAYVCLCMSYIHFDPARSFGDKYLGR